jgi:hypothetical protein
MSGPGIAPRRRTQQEIAEWHDEIQYHEDDASWHACDCCAGWSDGPPEHDNGMHVGVIVDDCPSCDVMGV